MNECHTVWPPRSPSSNVLLSLLPPAGSRVNTRTMIREEGQASLLITKFCTNSPKSRSARCHPCFEFVRSRHQMLETGCSDCGFSLFSLVLHPSAGIINRVILSNPSTCFSVQWPYPHSLLDALL